MSHWVPAISAAAGVVGAGVGGGVTYLSQSLERRQRARGELAAALVAFGHALDALQIEIKKIPRQTRFGELADSTINEQRFPALNYLLNWTYAKTFGRDAVRAIDRLMAAFNRLVLVAPPELMPILEQASALLIQVDARDASWDRRWSETRAQLTRESRRALGQRPG